MGPNKQIQIKVENKILIVKFKSKEFMNSILDSLSNNYEGILKNRQGHNFPAKFIPDKSHMLSEYKSSCEYVIGMYNPSGMAHELLHAKYYIDQSYRNKIIQEWNGLTKFQQTHITQFLKSIGYSEQVIIDEYQAYRYTEKENFFGIKI
jgi:hypothetical protein